ncbi:MAG: FAD/NAD(P)-binding protein [Sphingomonas bacterium]|nr:FAD/NAD(P)-binding protein [Sphingomonas bacterium]
MDPDDHIVIIGAGFSGTLLAINLLRHKGPNATLIDRHADQIARGIAYSSPHQSQLLNVRAKGMSPFPDDPDHFVRWVEAERGGAPTSFVPRAAYGAYLTDVLARARGEQPGRLTLREAAATDIVATDDGRQAVVLNDGTRIVADVIVLATGNLPPHTPDGIDPVSLPDGCYVEDPWRSDPADGLGTDDVVMLLGTGLTAVDVALELDAAGFGGTVLALSRRGLSPRRHVDAQIQAEPLHDPPALPLSHVVAAVRRRATGIDWRSAVDALRPVTQRFWHGADVATRARFLRHLRPYWDVHRHRLAPAVADRIDAMQTDGALRFAAGKVTRVMTEGSHLRVHWRPRHADAEVQIRVARIVNCTGPQGDLTRSDDPLLGTLYRRGLIRPDALRIGLDVTPQSRVIAADGTPADALYCIGPMTRGGLWEVVAVPDLRRQCWDLARRLSNAQWIGGEGL